MSALHTSLNSLLAAYAPEFGALNGSSAADQSARELQSIAGRLAPGARVSARFDYVVGENGQLQPTSTRITLGEDKDTTSGQSQRRANGRADGRQPSFSDLHSPRATLQPADEMALFALPEGGRMDGQASTTAQDETGTAIAVEILTGAAPSAQSDALADRRRQEISQLYARTNDIVYNVTPALQLAA